MTETTFTCKCGKQENWIEDGKISDPCPDCGRSYMGRYNNKTYTIDVIELNYPTEVVAFFKKGVEIKGWKISKNMFGTLPSPLDQFINKLKKKENDVTYTVSFKFEKEE